MRELAVQRAPDDVRVGDVVGDRADRREQRCPSRARRIASRRLASKKLVGERAVALDQERVEAEDLHFLGGLDAGAGLAHVVELAPLRRARVVERVALRVEVRLAEERRHQRDREQQRSATARRRRGRRRSSTTVTTSCAWPKSWLIRRHAPGGLPARALEPVLQLAVLEILEVERGRVLHQAQAGRVAELLRQQRVEQRDGAAEHVGEHRERRTRARAASRGGRAGRSRASARRSSAARRAPHQQHDLVDDQLADVERGDRQQRAHEAQQRLADASARGWSARPASGTAAGCAARRSARAATAAPRLVSSHWVRCDRSCCSLVPSGSPTSPRKGCTDRSRVAIPLLGRGAFSSAAAAQ